MSLQVASDNTIHISAAFDMIDAVQLVVEVQSTCNFTRKVQYFIFV
jgi:hypothetical protein